MLRFVTDLVPGEGNPTAIEPGKFGVLTDRRTFRRVKSAIRGVIFCSAPGRADSQDCVLIDISLGGALVECADAPPIGTGITLKAEGFHHIAGVVVRITSEGLVIGFDCANDTRENVAEEILLYLGGRRNNTPARRHERLQVPQARQFARPDGKLVDFCVIDLSLSGAYLETKIKPPIGELVSIGRSRGRIVRHLERGIAVEFIV